MYDEFGQPRLTYPWPKGGNAFSYDLGGVFYGGDLDHQSFLVECKKYANDNQGTEFDKFLAQSYVTLQKYPHLADNFLWITWTPFRIKKWSELYSTSAIKTAILAEKERIFGTVSSVEAQGEIDHEIVEDLAKRIWVIVLSDRQETLVISRDDRAELMKIRTLNEVF